MGLDAGHTVSVGISLQCSVVILYSSVCDFSVDDMQKLNPIP